MLIDTHKTSFEVVKLKLLEPCFSQGQLYVGCSGTVMRKYAHTYISTKKDRQYTCSQLRGSLKMTQAALYHSRSASGKRIIVHCISDSKEQ